MAKYSISVHSFYKKLCFKYRDSPDLLSSLHHICWFSFPIVYTDYISQCRVCESELDRIKQRRKRIRKYIRGMYDTFDELYLLTLTFSDDYIENDISTLKKYCRDYLNKVCFDYYACVDYGKVNGRLHFHAIVSLIPLLTFEKRHGVVFADFLNSDVGWSYGYYSIRPIRTNLSDTYKSLNYAFKTANYAFKNADSSVKPFHKRGVIHYSLLDDEEIFW